jgi:hypothetical protein
MKTITPVTYEEIAARAYTIWEQNGRPENRNEEYWLRAERELLQESQHARARTAADNERPSVSKTEIDIDEEDQRAFALWQANAR